MFIIYYKVNGYPIKIYYQKGQQFKNFLSLIISSLEFLKKQNCQNKISIKKLVKLIKLIKLIKLVNLITRILITLIIDKTQTIVK